MDKWTSMFYMEDIKKVVPEAKVQKRIPIREAGIGFVCNEPLLLFLSSSFFRQNFDNIGTIWYDVVMETIVSHIYWNLPVGSQRYVSCPPAKV